MARRSKGYVDEDENAPQGSVLLSDLAAGKTAADVETPAQRRRREEEERQDRAEELASLDNLSDGDFFKAVEELEYGEDVKFIVVRVKPAHKQGYVGEIPAADMSLETLKQKFGPGKYRCRAQGPKGFVAGGGSATVADFVPDEPHKQAEKDGSARAILNEFLAMQEIQEEKRRQDRKDMMTMLSPILVAVLPKLFESRGPDLTALVSAMKPPSMAEMVTVLTGLKALQGKETSEVDTLLRGMELAKDIRGSEEGTNWMDIVKEAIGPLLGTIRPGSLGRAFPMPPRQIAAPVVQQTDVQQTSVQQVPQQSPQPSAEEMNILQFLSWMREQLNYIIGQAARNRDPALYANLLLDNIPQDSAGNLAFPPDKLLEFISREDWWEQICRFESGCAPYKKWFEEFRTELIAALKDEEPTADEQH